MTDMTPSVTTDLPPDDRAGECRRPSNRRAVGIPLRAGPLRSAQRARCLRRRLHRPDEGREVAPDRQGRAVHARKPDASRRGRRRSADGRRRRRAGADSRPLLPRGDGRAGRRTAAGRPIWRRPLVHAAGCGAARAYRGRSSPKSAQSEGLPLHRLPRRAGRQFLAVQGAGHRGVRAVSPPGLHRPHRRHRRRRGIRGAALSPAQGHLRPHLCRERQQRHRLLLRVAVGAHHRLQGHVPGLPGRRLLQGPDGSALRDGADPRPPALLDQHLPVVEAGASLPHGRPQRRDQHAARQRQLDGGAPGLGRFRAVRQRHLQAVADLL